MTPTNGPPEPIFDIPNTEKTRAFNARNPLFLVAVANLLETSNKFFGRDPRPKNHLEYICFWLGNTCRQDLLEVAFLAINGYASGATKTLRSLYERAVTIDYLIQNPSKVDRFLQFATIQEHRLMEAALKIIPQEEIDANLRPENRVAEVRKRYEQYKGNFKARTCEVCGQKTPASWDVDLVSMVQRVGEPYKRLFLLACGGPNLEIHATLVSTEQRDEDREDKDAETALFVAIDLFLAVMRSQNALFQLNLDADIDARTKEFLVTYAASKNHGAARNSAEQ